MLAEWTTVHVMQEAKEPATKDMPAIKKKRGLVSVACFKLSPACGELVSN